jgi:maleate isomerase
MTSQTLERATPLSRQHMPHSLDPGLAGRARIGLIVLASDHTIEHEFHRVLGGLEGVTVYGSRVRNDPRITPETLAAMEERIAEATDLILPGLPLDVVGYGCTSASMVIGEDRVGERIREARPGVATTTPVTAARAAFAALGMRRIALLTPYVDSINQWMRRYFEERGVPVPVMGSFTEENDNDASRISLESIEAAALELGADPEVDGVFVSCTSLRLVAVAERLEARLGKPVTSSNHALIWHCLRLAGVSDAVPGYGRLFREPLA